MLSWCPHRIDGDEEVESRKNRTEPEYERSESRPNDAGFSFNAVRSVKGPTGIQPAADQYRRQQTTGSNHPEIETRQV